MHEVLERLTAIENHLKKLVSLSAEQGFKLDLIRRRLTPMSAELDALIAQVKANTDAEASAAQLIQGLITQIQANANDPAKITALTQELQASLSTLSSAVVAGTAVAPPAPPAPPAPAPATP